MEKPKPNMVSSQVIHSPSPSTTYVHADPHNFKQLVQRLTGPHDDNRTTAAAAATMKAVGVKRAPRPEYSRLKERRQSLPSNLMIQKPPVPPPCCLATPLVSPSTGFSNLSIVGEETNCCSSPSLDLNEEEEEKAIKEKRFYLHPSPRSTGPRSAEPELLPLFPQSSAMDKP